MATSERSEITRLLREMREGDHGAADALAPLVYRQLRAIAGRALAHEATGHTLQPTALVHDAFLVLAADRGVDWQDREHFFSLAARLMRRLLVDHARRRLAAKRGDGLRVTLDESLTSAGPSLADRTLDVIAIEQALMRLEALDARAARVVELRFFAGFGVEETARALRTSPASVKRDWVFARAVLKRELASSDGFEAATGAASPRASHDEPTPALPDQASLR